jgi:hypothetical protein
MNLDLWIIKVYIKYLSGILKRRDALETVDVDRRIILKKIVNK